MKFFLLPYSFIISFFLFIKIRSNIICLLCKKEISNSSDIVEIKSHIALFHEYKNIFGKFNVPVQVLSNPQKVHFEVFTTQNANLICQEESYEDSSFFAGYSWSVCVCPGCGIHHGWKFKPIENYCNMYKQEKMLLDQCLKRSEFFGLVLTNLDNESRQIEHVEF